MKLNLKNFRGFTQQSSPFRMRECTTCPLILIKGNGDVEYAKNRGEKDDLVRQYNPKKDLLLYVWAGEYSTDVFVVTENDLEKLYPDSKTMRVDYLNKQKDLKKNKGHYWSQFDGDVKTCVLCGMKLGLWDGKTSCSGSKT